MLRRRDVWWGRERECAALEMAFADAGAGHGRMICLAGEPGVGKTTIAETFLNALAAGQESFSTAVARAHQMGARALERRAAHRVV